MSNEYEDSSKGIVAANMKRLMKEKGVTASDVCRTLSIPNATFSDWLNAKTYPRARKLDMLCEYFGVNRGAILDLQVDKNDPLVRMLCSETEEGRLLSLWRKADAIDRQTIWNILSRYDEVSAGSRHSAG